MLGERIPWGDRCRPGVDKRNIEFWLIRCKPNRQKPVHDLVNTHNRLENKANPESKKSAWQGGVEPESSLSEAIFAPNHAESRRIDT